MIDPYQIKVDRWSAIHNFIHELLNGNYPYAAETHLHGFGSPFPVWQILHIPFYLLGNVGLSFSIATLLFIHSIYRLWGTNKSALALFLLVTSPAYLYEIMVRSDLVTNFLLSCAIVNFLIYYKVEMKSHYVILGILCGLMTCTRLSAVIPLALLYFSDFLHLSFKKKIVFTTIVVITAVIIFTPFLIWNGDMLLHSEYSPLTLQTRQSRPTDLLVFIPIAIFLAISWKRNYKYYYAFTAFFLCFMVAFTFILNMSERNDWNQLFNSTYDITYFDMSLVFTIAALSSFNKKRMMNQYESEKTTNNCD